MSEQERTVQGEWFEIRERWHRPGRVAEYLRGLGGDQPFEVFALSAANGLQSAVEGGVLEFKRAQVGSMYAQLAEAAYGNQIFTELESLAHRAGAIQLVIAYQRALLAEEIVPETGETTPQSDDAAAEGRHINQIVSDVRDIIAADPSAKVNASIKNIVVQLQRYREEQATYQKLKEQANTERLEMYARTFAATFAKIFESIRRNYASYLEEQDRTRRQVSRRGLVQASETGAWRKLLLTQAEDIARLRGVAVFALREHSGMRGPLVEESKGAEAVLAHIDAERSHADDVGGSEAAGAKLLRSQALQIEQLLRVHHPWSQAE